MLYKTAYSALLAAWFGGCGREAATVTTRPAPVDAAFAEVAAIVQANCSRCHNGSAQAGLDTPARVKAAKDRVASGQMPPPPAKLSASDRQKLLAYAAK